MASGGGSNVANFIRYFSRHPHIEVALVVSDNPGAGALQRSREAGVPCEVIGPGTWSDAEVLEQLFSSYGIDAVVLAGYLKLIPPRLVNRYAGRMFNIHPALLPDYGGKGMYGMHVHRAVIRANDRQSGISIHLVDEEYDRGPIIFQDTVEVVPTDSPETLAEKIRQLEHRHYPRVVEQYLMQETGRKGAVRNIHS